MGGVGDHEETRTDVKPVYPFVTTVCQGISTFRDPTGLCLQINVSVPCNSHFSPRSQLSIDCCTLLGRLHTIHRHCVIIRKGFGHCVAGVVGVDVWLLVMHCVTPVYAPARVVTCNTLPLGSGALSLCFPRERWMLVELSPQIPVCKRLVLFVT